MQITFLSYFLSAIVSYLGLLVGILLIKMAPEEQKPGRKYFVFLKAVFFFFIVALMLIYYHIQIIFSLAILALLFVLMISKKLSLEMSEIAIRNLPASARSKKAISEHAQKHAPHFSAGSVFDKSALVYLLFGFIFYFSSKIFDLFIIESALIFLYGIPASSLIIKLRKSNYQEIFIKNLWFFLPITLLYFL